MFSALRSTSKYRTPLSWDFEFKLERLLVVLTENKQTRKHAVTYLIIITVIRVKNYPQHAFLRRGSKAVGPMS